MAALFRLDYAFLLALIIAGLLPPTCDAGFFDYFLPTRPASTALDAALPTVPYELAERDEQFIREGAKLIGSPLSGLDMCHQRVVLALRKSCAAMDAEQLGKLAVMLLNCQSDSEGRAQYACTDGMSLAQCTTAMDADTWNAYHLITNRAKAVCATVRQDQFRGLAELTVNRLMDAAKEQVTLMAEVSGSQERLQAATEAALQGLGDNNGRLIDQQQEMMRVSEEHRASIETSLQDLMHEKSLIKAGQLEVAAMLADLKANLDDGIATVDAHAAQSRTNHADLLRDMDRLHRNAVEISARLEHAMEFVLTQSEQAALQFDQTVGKLNDIRGTVFDVAQVMQSVQADLERHFAWMAERVGGTERVAQTLLLAMQYGAYLLGGMLSLVFVGAGVFSRAVFLVAAVGGFAVNYARVAELRLGDLTMGVAAVILVNIIRQHVHLPTSLSMQPKAVEVPSTTKDPGPNISVEDEEDDDDEYYMNRSQHTKSFANKTLLGNGHSEHDAGNRRSMTPSVLHADRFERYATRSRSGTPFSLASAETRTRCMAITTKGDRCRHAAQLDGTRCAQHNRMYAER